VPGLGQEAAQFFAVNQSSSNAQQVSGPSAFDLATLHASLPAGPILSNNARLQSPPQTQLPFSSWASDFLLQPSQAVPALPPQLVQSESSIQGEQRQSSVQPFQPSMLLVLSNPIRLGLQKRSISVFIANVLHEPNASNFSASASADGAIFDAFQI
jgi:hypothetical protein